MLDDLNSIGWASYPQPSENSAFSVPDALCALTQATEANAEHLYHSFLVAVGNDHCGTYFPVVLPTIPFLGSLLEGKPSVTRALVLDVLIDLVAAFQPEPGFETVVTTDGPAEVKGLLQESVRRLVPMIQSVAESISTGTEERSLAEELLASLAADS